MKFGERYKGKRKIAAPECVDYAWGVEDVPMDFDCLWHDRIDGAAGRRES